MKLYLPGIKQCQPPDCLKKRTTGNKFGDSGSSPRHRQTFATCSKRRLGRTNSQEGTDGSSEALSSTPIISLHSVRSQSRSKLLLASLALLLGLTGNRHLSELAHRTHEAFELLGLPLLLAPRCRTVLNLHGSCTLRKKKCCSTSS